MNHILTYNEIDLLSCNHPETGELIIEEFRDVLNFETVYQVSNFGRVMSLPRTIVRGTRTYNPSARILKPGLDTSGYEIVLLANNGIRKTKAIHQLVAEAFLGHRSCLYEKVVNHKDFNRSNNFYLNLEIVTPRENSNQKHRKHSSKYTGVFRSASGKWTAQIYYNGSQKYLGTFQTEYDAHIAYEKELKTRHKKIKG